MKVALSLMSLWVWGEESGTHGDRGAVTLDT